MSNLEREYRDCIKGRDKIRITSHIMMHQVLYYIVQLPNEEGDMYII